MPAVAPRLQSPPLPDRRKNAIPTRSSRSVHHSPALAPIPVNVPHPRKRRNPSQGMKPHHVHKNVVVPSPPDVGLRKRNMRAKVGVSVRSALHRGQKRRKDALSRSTPLPRLPEDRPLKFSPRMTRSISRLTSPSSPDDSIDDVHEEDYEEDYEDVDGPHRINEFGTLNSISALPYHRDDTYLRSQATLRELVRLRKDHLITLISTFRNDFDVQDATKETLARAIIQNRKFSLSSSLPARGLRTSRTRQSSLSSSTSGNSQHTRRRALTGANRSSSMPDVGFLNQPRHQTRQISALGKSLTALNMDGSKLRNGKEFHGTDEFDEHDHPSDSSIFRRRRVAFITSRSNPRRRASDDDHENVFETDDSSISDLNEDCNSSDDDPTPIAKRTRSGSFRDMSGSQSSSADSQPDRHKFVAQPTPVAKRTRGAQGSKIVLNSSNSSPHFADLSGSNTIDSDGNLSDSTFDAQVCVDPDHQKGRYRMRARRGSRENGETDENGADEDEEIDGSDEAAAEEEEEEEEEADEANQRSEDILPEKMSAKELLRLRRDELTKCCEARDITAEGTKKDLVNALLRWRRQNFVFHGKDEEDEDLNPDSDSQLHSSSTIGADESKNETKTQALAKISNSIPSNSATPVLLRSRSSGEEDRATPPDAHQNETEVEDVLDLETLNLLDKEIPPEKLKKGTKIGDGGFKIVYEGKYRNVKVAIADFRGHLTEKDIMELGLLRDLHHENIVRFIGVSIPEEPREVPVMLVTELCLNGDLFDYIRKVKPPPFAKMLGIMRDISRGLEYLHTRKPAIIHRDLKSSNVLITARGVAKINDFGLARVKNTTRSMVRSLVGTVYYQAPELWVPHPRYNEKIDVYSCAMVYWEILTWHQRTKYYPFEGMNEHAVYQAAGQQGLRPSLATMGRQWGRDILDLIEKMWAQEPSSRLSMSEVVEEVEGQLAEHKRQLKDQQAR